MNIHRSFIFVIALLSIFSSPSFDGCGLVYIDGLIGDYSINQLLINSDFRWMQDSSNSSNIYYEPNSWAARNIAAIRRDTDSSLVRILCLLAERSFPFKLSYFIVGDRSRMQSLIGRQTNGIAFVRQRIICAIAGDSVRALGPHEMFHVVAVNLWSSTGDWINEGMAVYADNSWWMEELHPLANFLRLRGKLLSMDQLSQRFRQHDPMITYPQAGSFLKYLYETYGRDDVKTLWQQGLGAFCDSVHVKKSQLERQWLSVIAACDTNNIHYRIPG